MNHEARQKRVICLGLVIETKIKIFGLPFTSFQLKKKIFTEDKEIKIKKKKKVQGCWCGTSELLAAGNIWAVWYSWAKSVKRWWGNTPKWLDSWVSCVSSS